MDPKLYEGDFLKGSVDLGREVLLGSKTPQEGSWRIDTQPHSPSALGYPAGAFHWLNPTGNQRAKMIQPQWPRLLGHRVGRTII